MTNPDLQAALIPLAEKNGLTVRYISPMTKENLVWVKSSSEWGTFPGADGTLEGEVELVLGWLAKAGYNITLGWADDHKCFIIAGFHEWNVDPQAAEYDGETLHAALESAVIALHEATT